MCIGTGESGIKTGGGWVSRRDPPGVPRLGGGVWHVGLSVLKTGWYELDQDKLITLPCLEASCSPSVERVQFTSCFLLPPFCQPMSLDVLVTYGVDCCS